MSLAGGQGRARRAPLRAVLVSSLDRGGPVEQALVLGGELARREVEVRAVCATRELAERFAQVGADPVVLPLRHQVDLANARRMWHHARGADVVHAHDRRTGLWVRLGPRPSPGGVRVYTAHGIPSAYHPPPVGKRRPGVVNTLAYRGVDAKLAWRADAVVVPSRAVAEDLVRRLGWPRSRLVVIPNGVDPPPLLPERGSLVGTLSVLEPFKGLDVFLRAAAELAGKRADLRFAMFGTGSQGEALQRLAGELGLADRLEAPGFVPAASALPRLAVYVLSSWWENAPMALLEAMATGVPVVASRVDGVPEIVDERTAQLVPPGDHHAIARAVARLLDDEDLVRRQTAAARERVDERFTATRNAAAVLELYERLLARRASDATAGGGA